ncbi:MAG: hypothetical protein PHT48_02995 [Dechloromonas sp.]|nr:hypothetical protein [Dechloromonas sp.]
MFPAAFTKRINHPQAGNTLLDALIAMIITAVIALGSILISAKASVAQRQSFAQEQAAVQLRALMNSAPSAAGTPLIDQCATGAKTIQQTITIKGTNLAVTVNCESIGESLLVQNNAGGQQTLDLPEDLPAKYQLSMSVTSSDWFGEDGAMKVGHSTSTKTP